MGPCVPAKDSPFPSSRDSARTDRPALLLGADWLTLPSRPRFLPDKGTVVPKHLQTWPGCRVRDHPHPVSAAPLALFSHLLPKRLHNPLPPRRCLLPTARSGSLHGRPRGSWGRCPERERLRLPGWEACDLDGGLPWAPGGQAACCDVPAKGTGSAGRQR